MYFTLSLIYLTFKHLVHFATTRFLMSHVMSFWLHYVIYYIFGTRDLTQNQKTSILPLFHVNFYKTFYFLYFLILLIIKKIKFLII